MELSWSVLEELGGTSAAFLPTTSYGANIAKKPISWESSNLNPKNRIDTLDPLQEPKWRIDGCGLAGRQVFVTPSFLGHNILPLRIDMFLPDQTEIPESLRDSLECCRAADAIEDHMSSLGISRFLARALQNWSDGQPDFEKMYNGLPFGSKIVLEQLNASAREIKINIIPAFDIEHQLLSVKSLQSLWNLPESTWPPTVHLSETRLVRQLNESISLIQIPHLHSTKLFAMKSQTVQPRYLYHELKLLLTIPPHPNIIPPPLYVVTKKCAFGGKLGVCGIISDYHSHGTLHDTLISRTLAGTMRLEEQLSWAKQIVSALIHVNQTAEVYYPDLKPDNILLVPSSSTIAQLTPVLIDFEQRGNGTSWAALPILYAQYLEELSSSSSLSLTLQNHYNSILQAYISKHISPADALHLKKVKKYTNPDQGYNIPWLALSIQEREAALVFNLGKFLWCIFEGIPYPHRGLWVKSGYYPYIPYEFPETRTSPKEVRHTIEMCMQGTWKLNPARKNQGLTRRGSCVIPKGREGDDEIGEGEVRDAAQAYWMEEISRMEDFFEFKNSGESSLGEMRFPHSKFSGTTGLHDGVTLKDILSALEDIR